MANYRKLGRVTSHRNLMLRNLVTDLLRNGRIETTVTRAKETRRMAEKMITLAKRGDLPLPIISDSRASVSCFSPGHFRRRTSRPVSYYALF